MNGGLKQTIHNKGPWRECQECSCKDLEYEEHLGESDRGRTLSHLRNTFFRPRTDPDLSASQQTQAKQMVKMNLGVFF